MARGSRRGPFQPALAPPFHGGSWLESNGMPEGGGVTARCGHQPTIRTQKRRKPPRLPLAAPRNSFSCQPPTIRTPGARSLRRAPSVDARASTTRRLSRSASDFGTSASQDTRSAPRKGCQGEIEPASREGRCDHAFLLAVVPAHALRDQPRASCAQKNGCGFSLRRSAITRPARAVR